MPGEQQPTLSPQDQAMADKFDQATANAQAAAGVQPEQQPQQPAAVERPAHVPEKFWDATTGTVNTEAWAKSYGELEAAKSGQPAKPETPPADGQTPEQQAAAEAVKAAKLDMGALQQEFAQTGALSAASLTALEGAGISKEMVDAYVAGQQALVDRAVAEVHSSVGGADKYAAMIQWAGANLSPAEQAAYDQAVMGSPEQAKLAVAGLQAKFTAANGSEPNLLGGRQGAGGSESETPFASTGEMVKAMSDPRYRNDAAYRAVVERRAGLSDF